MPHVTHLQPKDFGSDLDQIAREGARRMLAQALEAEVADYIARNQERGADGHALVVRNGKARARKLTLGSGTIDVRAPRVDDRRETEDGSRHRFRSQILPPYMCRSPKVAEVLPILYLRGLSTGDFKEGLAALLGEDAAGLSPTAITRLTSAWQADYETFQKRDLSDRDYVYLWADGVHFRIRLEEDRLCALVMIGVRPDGTKELIAIEDGDRESTESWAGLLRDLKRRGMRAPVLTVGDGALGFWKALRDVWPETREQRCWVHRIANVLDKLPKRLRSTRSCAPRHGRRPSGPSRALRPTTGPNTRRPWPRYGETRPNYWPSSTSRPSIGCICGRGT
jgi:transposase-like protein